MSDRSASQAPAQNLTWLLQRLVEDVPGTRSALLLSTDGLARSSYGLNREDAEVLAATASGLCSLARTAGSRFGGGDGVRQLVAELPGVVLFVTAAGPGAVLAVLAGNEADVGVLGYQMAQLGKQLPAHLATPLRHELVATDERSR